MYEAYAQTSHYRLQFFLWIYAECMHADGDRQTDRQKQTDRNRQTDRQIETDRQTDTSPSTLTHMHVRHNMQINACIRQLLQHICVYQY